MDLIILELRSLETKSWTVVKLLAHCYEHIWPPGIYKNAHDLIHTKNTYTQWAQSPPTHSE